MSTELSKRFAVHVLMFDCDEFILRMIDNCAPFVDRIYVAYSKVPWNAYNPRARKQYKNTTDKSIVKLSRHVDKIELIEGVWDTDEDQRNACLDRARQDGFDYLIIQDADEFYTNEDYQNNLLEISRNPDWDSYVTPWYVFWKSLDYVWEDQEGSIALGYPEFALNCRTDVRFTRSRRNNAEKHYQLPGLCFHLSYVRTDEKIYRKIRTWGHAHQFDSDAWYHFKWRRWNDATTDLHPFPGTVRRAVRYTGRLPEVLADFESPPVTISVPTLANRIEDCFLYWCFWMRRLGRLTEHGTRRAVRKLINTIRTAFSIESLNR